MAIYAPHTPVARARRAVVVAVLIAIAAVVGPQAFANDATAAPVELDTYTVSPGDTLWSIAGSITGAGEDLRDTVDLLKKLNAMGDATLIAGEQIVLPALAP